MESQLNPAVVQVVRSIVQAAWSALFAIVGVSEFFEAIGVAPDAALGIAFPIALGLVVILGRALANVHPIFGYLFNGIHRNPEYALAA